MAILKCYETFQTLDLSDTGRVAKFSKEYHFKIVPDHEDTDDFCIPFFEDIPLFEDISLFEVASYTIV